MIYGVLGGTFDPPHMGHQQMIKMALESSLIDEILVIPCFKHAFAKDPAPFKNRVAMCKIFFRNKDRVTILDIEKKMEHPGRTLDLLNMLIMLYPQNDFRLVVGLDIYNERHKWYKFEKVQAMAPPLYFLRSGVAINHDVNLDLMPAPVEISSSQLREKIKKGVNVKNYVASSIMKYIIKNRLYGVKK